MEYLSGHVEHAGGNLEAARDRFARSLEVFRTLAIPAGIGNALSGMAVIALATGDADEAECLLDEATSMLRQAGPWFLTWALYGPMPLISKIMCVFMNLDKMVGGDMERGLKDLKALAER